MGIRINLQWCFRWCTWLTRILPRGGVIFQTYDGSSLSIWAVWLHWEHRKNTNITLIRYHINWSLNKVIHTFKDLKLKNWQITLKLKLYAETKSKHKNNMNLWDSPQLAEVLLSTSVVSLLEQNYQIVLQYSMSCSSWHTVFQCNMSGSQACFLCAYAIPK